MTRCSMQTDILTSSPHPRHYVHRIERMKLHHPVKYEVIRMISWVSPSCIQLIFILFTWLRVCRSPASILEDQTQLRFITTLIRIIADTLVSIPMVARCPVCPDHVSASCHQFQPFTACTEAWSMREYPRLSIL